jgi:NAD(P)-dependent dehydrogenase (short-subunit alcohol dehydrogenase family)
MSINIDLSNKKAIVTGVTSGIGAGIAQTLAKAGCDIAGCGLEPSQSEGAMRFIATTEAAGRKSFYRQANIAVAASAREFIEWSASQLNGIDIVISNAGGNIFKGVEGTTEQDWEANINLNLSSHWRVAQTAKPHLDKSPEPVIIVIASNHAYYTIPNSFPYNVAKTGLTAMVQSLAIEWGPHLRAVGIAPGFINTPLADMWFNSFPDPAAKRKQIEDLHPVGRLGTPQDIGALCAFLCSPLAGNISGNTILIDGGRSAVMQDV